MDNIHYETIKKNRKLGEFVQEEEDAVIKLIETPEVLGSEVHILVGEAINGYDWDLMRYIIGKKK